VGRTDLNSFVKEHYALDGQTTEPCKITLTVTHCAVPENINTPNTEGIGISCSAGASIGPKKLKKCLRLNWNFQTGGGRGMFEKSLPWGRYGYFMELHNLSKFV